MGLATPVEIAEPPPTSAEHGATAVITHRVAPQHQRAYDAWLSDIGAVCRAWPGHLDWQIVRPIPELTETYTVVIRFDTREHLQGWLESPERAAFIDRVRPMLLHDDRFYVRTGLDFWFTPEGAKAALPVRWKQFVVTWSAIYPLALAVPLAVVPLLRGLGLPQSRFTDTLCITGVVVFSMTYVVMPRYTRLVRKWLFA